MLSLILLLSIIICNFASSSTVRMVYRSSVAVWPILIGLFMLKVYWPQIAERMQRAIHMIYELPGM